jgi:hypothetical protein
MISHIFANFVIFCGSQFNYLYELDTGWISKFDLSTKIYAHIDYDNLTIGTILESTEYWRELCR